MQGMPQANLQQEVKAINNVSQLKITSDKYTTMKTC